ncbi:uncharacterized protein LOC125232334 [Leguminivora glycinivorella]|uniref:uncharacterized protein LOC125232334 n=1 Tax=Leguminivora glycinivorella TaxID=1035111 RepID=UPI00200ED024|nr:uncharacterized protein LOC125232334 [Leguminivora glycinivorella]
MELHVRSALALALAAACCAWSASAAETETYEAETEAGRVCGGYDPAGNYTYFLAVPYAKQPLGQLRFQELQSPDPWTGCRPATEMGPICPQEDLFYGPIMDPHGQSEECIHANIYVPLESLPCRRGRGRRALLPVLVYVHGGGFGFGSGDPDAHGPQYLVKENVVVITFNYRIGAFGFLSLNSSRVPGNAGLRDMVTLLRWVQRNAKAFGGDPSDVTLAGQSAGSVAVHLLSLSKAANGLFKRAISMSGAGSRTFFTTSPAYAQTALQLFLGFLGINSTDPEEVHQKLTVLPLEQIMVAQKQIHDYTGVVSFTPVVESEHPGVTIILDDDPEVLQAQGRGKHIPFIIGFTSAECQTFRPRFQQIDIVERIKNMPAVLLPLEVTYKTLPAELPSKIESVQKEYFNRSSVVDLDAFLNYCTDSYFIYPALKMAKSRAANKGAPVFLYRFGHNADNSVYKNALNLTYFGAGHSEDLTFVFRANYALRDVTVDSPADSAIVTKMTSFFTNFMRHGKPTTNVELKADISMFTKLSKDFFASFIPYYRKPTTTDKEWRPVSEGAEGAPYHNIVNYEEADPWPAYQGVVKFFDSLYETSEPHAVQTAQGALRGEAGDGLVSYRGVPYGSLRGEARFKLAGLAPTWTGLREAERPTCPASFAEQCLWLDVHVPAAGGPWPVLAWLAAGGGPYHPALLVRQGIVLVVIHHRLGPVGFLCTKEEQIPGNAGAKDVVSALRWVRDNIVAFRGNPASVVVGGQGFGAAIVEGLTVTPMADGLFHGAIMQSGSILSPWAFNYDATERALKLGKLYTGSDAIASSLLKADDVDLADKADKLDLPYYPYGMCAEKAFKREERFLMEPPFNSLSSHKARSVPMIVGFNSEEGYVFAAMLKALRILKRIVKDFKILLPEELRSLNDRELKRIKDIYFDGKVNMSDVLAYHRDAYFVSHIHRSARLHAAAAPVYYYQFAHAGAWGAEPERGIPKTGAAHGDELAFLFPDKGQEFEGDDGEVQHTMVRLWTNFVKYLQPTRDETPRWEAGTDSLLEIAAGGAAMRPFPHARACRLWDDLYERHYYNRPRNSG